MGHCISKETSATGKADHSSPTQPRNYLSKRNDHTDSDLNAPDDQADIPGLACDVGQPNITNQLSQPVAEQKPSAADDKEWALPRSKREPWEKYLKQGYWQDLFHNHTREINIMPVLGGGNILKGDIADIVEKEPQVFAIFLSSTFTDTEEERNLLLEDVQPFLREVCSLFGYEFRFCEMRWGVRDEASEDHQTANLCMQELLRCQKESRGLNFITFLCDKYGYCPFPSEIPEGEFEELLDHVDEKSSKNTLQKWFKIDTNMQESSYVLQKISSILKDYNSNDSEKRKEARNSWWSDFESMQHTLKKASQFLKSDERKQFYEISVTEFEVFNGLLDITDVNEKTFMINRVIVDIERNLEHGNAGRFIDIDWSSKSVNKESRTRLLALKTQKTRDKLDSKRIKQYDIEWCKNGVNTETHLAYLHDVTDTICRVVLDSIELRFIDCEKQRNGSGAFNTVHEKLVSEVSLGAVIMKRWSNNAITRTEILHRIQNYCSFEELSNPVNSECSKSQPLVIFGESGSGKSTIMSLAIKNAIDKRSENSVVIYRLVGSTPDSGRTMDLLGSLIRQLRAVCGKDSDANDHSDNLHYLGNRFKQEIEELDDRTPVTIFLDAMDQLTDVNMISEVEWLPKVLPPAVRIVISCTPSADAGTAYFTYLQRCFGVANFVEVVGVNENLCKKMLQTWLELDKRRLTMEQTKVRRLPAHYSYSPAV